MSDEGQFICFGFAFVLFVAIAVAELNRTGRVTTWALSAFAFASWVLVYLWSAAVVAFE